MNDHESERLRRWPARAWLLAGLGLVFAVYTIYLLWPNTLLRFPTWFWPYPQPWWWPFKVQPHAPSSTSLLAGLGAALALGLLAVRGDRLARWQMLLALVATTGALQLAFILLPGRGLLPYPAHIARTSRSEFFLRAAEQPSLWHALTHYEELLVDGKPAKFSRQKGPANLAFFVAVFKAAQRSPLAGWLDAIADVDPQLVARTTEQLNAKWRGKFGTLDPARGRQLVRALLLMPVVVLCLRALLPAAVLLLGLTLLPRRGALQLALAAVLLPAVRFDHVRVDGSLYALCFALIITLAAWKPAQRRWRAPLLAGLTTCGYAYFTAGALAAVALLLFVAGLELTTALWSRRGVALAANTEPDLAHSPTRIALNLGLYLVSIVLGLLALRLALSFHVVDRFQDARSLQAHWRGDGPAWQWAVLNCVEFLLTLGPILTGLAMLGTGLSVVALAHRRPTLLHLYALAALLMFVALNVLGSNSEVHRLWAFVGVAALLPAAVGMEALVDVDHVRDRALLVAAMAGWLVLQSTRFSLYGMVAG